MNISTINNLIEYFKEHKHLALAIVFVSVGSLSSAYIAEYVFGLKPCILCLYQRVPYALNIVLGFLAFMATCRYPKIVKPLLWLTAISFFTGGLIAAFHSGVEYKWWHGLASCSGNNELINASLDQLKNLLNSQEIVRCDTPAWTMFGISMAGYNFLASMGLTGVTSLLLLVKKK